MSKTNRIAKKFSSIGWKRGCWILPPSMRTSKHLTAFCLIGRWISSVADSHARTSALQGSEQESTEKEAAFGATSPESLAKYDRDSSLWKTSQLSLEGDLVEFSETWPRSGMTRSGIAFPLPPLALLTKGIGSGLWHTPTADDSANRKYACNNRGEPKLSAQVKMWRSPQAANATQGPKSKEFFEKCLKTNDSQITLTDQVRHWPTPSASQARSEGMINQMRAKVEKGELAREEAEAMIGGSLEPARMKKWPPPIANDAEKRGIPKVGAGLAGAVHKWPTPTKADGMGGPGSSDRQGGDNLRTATGGSLNPTWVEWLMGYPLGWTALKDSETQSFRKSQSGSDEG